MENKKTSASKISGISKKLVTKTKPKSLRPMRSMVAVRSMKSNTTVAKFNQTDGETSLN